MFQFRLKTFDNKKYWPHDKCLPKYNDGSAAPDDDDDDDDNETLVPFIPLLLVWIVE